MLTEPDRALEDDNVANGALLSLRGLTRRFGDFTAVDRIDLDARRGEIVALLGPNGAGKTTTMRMVIGTLEPDAGTARIDGHDCFRERHICMRSTGYVPDEPTFPGFATGYDLLCFQGEVHGLSRIEIAETVEPLAARLQMKDALDDYAVDYSKGMKKKLAVMLALLHGPELLVLDELTNGLDPYATRALHEMMRERRAAGCAILFSTHLLDQAERLCDKLAIMHHSRLAASGTLAELSREAGAGGLEELFFRHTGSTSDETTPEPGEDDRP